MDNFEEMYQSLYQVILDEHELVFKRQDLAGIERLMDAITKSKRIFVMGVGREGLTAKSFAMRLMHLGYEVYWIWDDTTPGMHAGDLFITVNGSGNISHINCVIENAQKTEASIFAITGSPSGKVSSLVQDYLFVPAAVYKGIDDVVPSVQPMGNLFEQHLFMLFDIIIMALEQRLKVSHDQMSDRHRNIE